MKQVDIVIVGAGMLGLAHALHAARAGCSVAVFDQSPRADGASVRNFGMLAVFAQARGLKLDSARRSLEIWQDIAPRARIGMRQAGCLFVAREAEELSVLAEFAGSAMNAEQKAVLLTQDELADYTPSLCRQNTLGGLFNVNTWKIDQREAMAKIADWLGREYGVKFYFSTKVNGIANSLVETSAGKFKTGHTVICAGDEFSTLFPDAFQASGITRCQLQMLRTRPQPEKWRLDPFILGGLSIPRYSVFASCKSLPSLIQHQQRRYKDHLEHGIHAIACQEPDGSITIGDSHLYSGDMDEERSPEVDRLILADLAGIIALPEKRIADRWLGHYAFLSGQDFLELSPAEGVTAVTVANGQGMTHGFAIAQDVIHDLNL